MKKAQSYISKYLLATCFLLAAVISIHAQQWHSRFVKPGDKGQLQYTPDSLGNILPDFSGVGYQKNRVPFPYVPVVRVVSPNGLHDLDSIQAAIDAVSALPVNKNGFRGAIRLTTGSYFIPGTIRIKASGIILRGDGEKTILIATGKGQRSLIVASGSGKLEKTEAGTHKIMDHYVPVGAKTITIDDATGLKAGDSVILFRPATQQWIRDIRMDQIEMRDSTIRQWDPGEYGLKYERVITRIDKNRVVLDNPVVMAIDDKYGGGEIYKYSYNGRLWNVAVEDITCRSEYAGEEDEDHGWDAIHFNRLVNGWVKNVTAYHFGYSCVNLGYDARNITVVNCRYLEPKSKITGSRRYSFNNDGQLNLFMDCFASEGRHDFVTGARVCGPNVFFRCRAEKTNADIGPHHRWATGTLYDNIITDGEINVQDRGNWGTGHGWAGANQVIWNCVVARAAIQNPWTSANNYVIGLQGQQYEGRLKGRPDAIWEGHNKPGLQPQSLYSAQLSAAKKSK